MFTRVGSLLTIPLSIAFLASVPGSVEATGTPRPELFLCGTPPPDHPPGHAGLRVLTYKPIDKYWLTLRIRDTDAQSTGGWLNLGYQNSNFASGTGAGTPGVTAPDGYYFVDCARAFATEQGYRPLVLIYAQYEMYWESVNDDVGFIADHQYVQPVFSFPAGG